MGWGAGGQRTLCGQRIVGRAGDSGLLVEQGTVESWWSRVQGTKDTALGGTINCYGGERSRGHYGSDVMGDRGHCYRGTVDTAIGWTLLRTTSPLGTPSPLGMGTPSPLRAEPHFP